MSLNPQQFAGNPFYALAAAIPSGQTRVGNPWMSTRKFRKIGEMQLGWDLQRMGAAHGHAMERMNAEHANTMEYHDSWQNARVRMLRERGKQFRANVKAQAQYPNPSAQPPTPQRPNLWTP